MPFTEEQLHDLMGVEGPPSIRQLALQSMSTRNDAFQDERRDMKQQHPTVLQQSVPLMRKQIQETEEKKQKKVRFDEDKNEYFENKEQAKPKEETAKSINLHTSERLSIKRSDNLFVGLLIAVSLGALFVIILRSCKK